MANNRLRDSLHTKGLAPSDLADELGVDPKTVERWITKSRTPYPRYRHAIAARLRESERYLWPDALAEDEAARVSQSEVVSVYSNRNAVPADLWDQLLDRASVYIDVLVYVGMFMTDKPTLLETLKAKAEKGARIRLAFGDRDGRAIAQRSVDEGIGEHTIAAKIDHALAYFAPLNGVRGVQLRVHDTVLYNSIYRFDDQMIVNTHLFGKPGAHAPALHLRRLSAGDMFTTYEDSFTSVWEHARRVN
jgi:hypothetical protein